MAEILIKATDNINSDPELDKLTYKRGHVVAVFEDGHIWGKLECPPVFVIIKLPGVSVEEVEKYTEPDTTDNADGTKKIINRRIWKIAVDNLPKAVLTKLDKGAITVKGKDFSGTGDITWSQIKTRIKNGKTGLSEAKDL